MATEYTALNWEPPCFYHHVRFLIFSLPIGYQRMRRF